MDCLSHTLSHFCTCVSPVPTQAAGATVVTGGSPVKGAEGYFYEPTLVTGVGEGVRLVDEEQFGPVVPVMKYSTDEEVVR